MVERPTDGCLGLVGVAEIILKQGRFTERASGVGPDDRIVRVVLAEDSIIECQGVFSLLAAQLEQARDASEPVVVDPSEHCLDG